MFGDLLQRPRQTGVATPQDFIFGGSPQVPSLDFQVECPRCNVHWLYLVIVYVLPDYGKCLVLLLRVENVVDLAFIVNWFS
jgi:hypothetical protein